MELFAVSQGVEKHAVATLKILSLLMEGGALVGSVLHLPPA